jgi:hypothetical protein
MHGAACAQHVSEWPLAAGFFGALAVAQLGLGAWLWARADTAALIAGAAGSGAVLALWTVTRTAGLPFGPEAGHPESVGVLDVVAGADELLFAACAVALMHDRGHLLRHPVVLRAALIASLAAAMLAGGHPIERGSDDAVTLNASGPTGAAARAVTRSPAESKHNTNRRRGT